MVNGINVAGRTLAPPPIRRCANKTIQCDYGTIHGNGNKIIGKYNTIVGDGNTITGNYNELHGTGCTATGNYNVINGVEQTRGGGAAAGSSVVVNYSGAGGPASFFSSFMGGGGGHGSSVVSVGRGNIIAMNGQVWIDGVLQESKGPAVAPPPVREKVPESMADTPVPEGNSDESKVCKICMASLVATLVLDCKHSYMCPSCARTEPDKCAICRKVIVKGIIPVFSA